MLNISWRVVLILLLIGCGHDNHVLLTETPPANSSTSDKPSSGDSQPSNTGTNTGSTDNNSPETSDNHSTPDSNLTPTAAPGISTITENTQLACDVLIPTNAPADELLIPTPPDLFVVNVTNVRIHIPNKMFAMALGYAQEFYQEHPYFLMSLAAKETMADLEDSNGHPLFAEIIQGNPGDGPFQIEAGAFQELGEVLPDRVSVAEQSYHDTYVQDWVTGTVAATLDLHYRYNYLQACQKYQFNDFLRQAHDPLAAFHLTAYSYNQGTRSLFPFLIDHRDACLATSDMPSPPCGVNGYADYNINIKNVCTLLSKSNQFYEATISWEEINQFLGKLHFTYPKISDDTWTHATDSAKQFFLSRAQGGLISLRKDWRPLLRTLKTLLSFQENFTTDAWGWFLNGWPCK